MKKQQPLGDRQIGCLEALLSHGGYPGGWQWSTPGVTRKILRSLQRRGYCVARASGGVEISREGICKLREIDGPVRYKGKNYSPSFCIDEWVKFIRQFPLAGEL